MRVGKAPPGVCPSARASVGESVSSPPGGLGFRATRSQTLASANETRGRHPRRPLASTARETKEALRHMKGGGRIITIGSCVGEHVLLPEMAPYSATKGAIKMFTQGLAREFGARGITVNNIQPGPIDTDLNPSTDEWAIPQKANVPLDRYGSVDEVAALVSFIAGPESSYVNGANLTVDGGTNA
ncbi:MAG TPA: SDR family oxidoreductase [Polyangiaceae bacterium]|nr:SDR family oxidoreductase [Polyangiaceae bacterium]